MVIVMVTGKMSFHGSDEKTMKENDQDNADKMKQEVDSKDRVMHVEMCDL